MIEPDREGWVDAWVRQQQRSLNFKDLFGTNPISR
jgi:hypothetical protein